MADKLILPGIPAQPDPAAGVAFPMMKGFACPVATPFMGADKGPPEGIGVGWSNVAGQGVRFFVSVHAEGGYAMIAQLDYARYMRFAENLAGVGRQALMSGNLDETSENDPLKALAVAHEALNEAVNELWDRDHSGMDREQFERENAALIEARDTVAKALMIDGKDEA